MKKKIVITMVLFSTLFVAAPTASVSAAEIQTETQAEVNETSAQGDIATYADVIETKYRLYKNKAQYRRWNATRGYWVDKDWIDL